MLLGRYLELIKGVSPQLLHVMPVLDNSMLNGVVKPEYAFVLLDDVANEYVLLIGGDHYFIVLGSAHTTNNYLFS